MNYNINVVEITSYDQFIFSILRQVVPIDWPENEDGPFDESIRLGFGSAITKGEKVYVPEETFNRGLAALRDLAFATEHASIIALLDIFEAAPTLPITDLIDYYDFDQATGEVALRKRKEPDSYQTIPPNISPTAH